MWNKHTDDATVRQVQAGFTLLELLVVMVIIGLLAGYVGPKYFAQLGKSETKTAKAQVEALARALDTYRLDVGSYPTSEQGLPALNVAPVGVNGWRGPYLSKAVPLDPWGRSYHYRSPGEHGEFDVWTLGRDNAPGGEDAEQDVGSW